MSSYTQILFQIVFASKNRAPFLNIINEEALFNYMAGIVLHRRSIPYQVGGFGNHIHIIVSLHPSESISNLVRDVKRASHFWMLDKKEHYKRFPGWQVGYGAFTYSLSAKNNLINYVKNQDPHHRKISYEEEYIKLLKEYDIKYDLKYLFV